MEGLVEELMGGCIDSWTWGWEEGWMEALVDG